MICPYCNKDTTLFKEKLIIDSIKKNKEISIAKLQRLTSIKRSTLIYYLNNLKSKHLIKTKRIEKRETGRPTMVRINHNTTIQKSNEQSN